MGKKSDISRIYNIAFHSIPIKSDPKFTFPLSDRIESDSCTALGACIC